MDVKQLEPALIAEPLGHRARPFDVAEQDRHGAVGRGVATEVGPLALHRRGDGVDRCRKSPRLDALGSELQRERLRHEALHAEGVGGVEGATEQAERLLPVARVTAGEQRAGIVVLGVSHPGPRPDPRVHFERGLEVPRGLLPAGHRAGEETEGAVERARTDRGDAVHRAARGVGKQQLVQLCCAVGIAEVGAGVGEEYELGDPLEVPWQRGEVVVREPAGGAG